MRISGLSLIDMPNLGSIVGAYFFLYFLQRHSIQSFTLHRLFPIEVKVRTHFCHKHFRYLSFYKAIQAVYNFLFGLYISHIFSRQHALISSLVLQVYANFLGYPEYFEILKGNIQDDRVKSKMLIMQDQPSSTW